VSSKRATVKNILPLGTWVITPYGAGEVTAASNQQATITGLFRNQRRDYLLGGGGHTWETERHVYGIAEARSLRQATEAQAREVLDAELAKQAEVEAAFHRREAERVERERLTAQRTRILKDIGRRLDLMDADALDRLERSLSDIAPVVDALCLQSPTPKGAP
jgi:hypothetical protein